MPGVGLEEGPVKGLGLQARPLREVSPEEEGEGLFPFLQVLQGLGVVLALVQPQGPVVGGLGPKEVPVDGLEKAQVVVGGGVGGKGHRPLRGLDGPGEVPGEVVGPAQVGPVEPVVRAEGEGLEEGLLGLLPLAFLEGGEAHLLPGQGKLGEGLRQPPRRGLPALVLQGPEEEVGGRPFQHVPLLHGLRQGQGLLPFPLGEEPEGLVGPGKLPLPEEEEPFREKPLKKPAPPALLQVQGRAVQGVGGLPLGQGAKPFLREAGGGEGGEPRGEPLALEPEPGELWGLEEPLLGAALPGEDEPEAPFLLPSEEHPVRSRGRPGEPGPRLGVKPPGELVASPPGEVGEEEGEEGGGRGL